MPEISKAELTKLHALAKEARGVFVFNTQPTPAPGPNPDTPAERLRKKREANA